MHQRSGTPTSSPATRKSPETSLDPETVYLGEPAKSVLIVEDDRELADVLRALVKSRGYEVCVAHRGVEALWDVLSRDYDAIVCDMVMPTMPGDMFYLAVKKMKPHLCRRFLFITGHHHEPKIAAFLSSVSGAVLLKPLDTAALFLQIAAVIEDTARRQQLALEPTGLV
jgi:DNA-binding response OmpR family regulator